MARGGERSRIVTKRRGEGYCRNVFDDGTACRRAAGHRGPHVPNNNGGETTMTAPQIKWATEHAPLCPVTKERIDLLSALAADPTNESLRGAIPEYDGGDQEAENCTCHVLNRTMLVHLNVLVPRTDGRTVEEIEQALQGALEVGSDDDSVRDLRVAFAMSEEI